MASTAQVSDPKSFKTWEDAFAHPIPAVRRMEQQLRTDISSNRERLRSLVGGSYRDLLGTADTIIDMDGQMHGVEALVARIGRHCNSGLLERTKRQSRQLMGATRQQVVDGKGRRAGETAVKVNRGDLVFASRLAVFKACPDVILRVLRRKERLLTAAKVLVISRSLYRHLKERGDGMFSELVDEVFGRLGRVRAKLVEAIELCLGRVASTAEDLVDAMTAYALAATASTADIMRHFHKVRKAAMLHSLRFGSDRGQRPVKAIQVWLHTLRDTPTLFPRQISQALGRLKAGPMLEGEDVQGIAALELDIHQTWLGEDITGFIPYVKNDDLDVAAAKAQLSTWAPDAFRSLVKGTESFLESSGDLMEVSKMRQDCLTAWFQGSGRIAGIPRSDVLEGLRSVFTRKLVSVTKARCEALDKVAEKIKDTLANWSGETTKPSAPSLWDDSVVEMDIAHGAKTFISSLHSSLQGRTQAVEQCLQDYRTWHKSVAEVDTAIQAQRKIKWQDVSDDYDEDYDEEESRDQLLSKDDPETLRRTLESSVASAIERYHESLSQTSESLLDSPSANEKAAFMLRFLREALSSLPTSYKTEFDTAFVARLYTPLATPIVSRVVGNSRNSILRSVKQDKLAVRPLWDEKTKLPIYPSPWAVKLIRDCQRAMESAGADLWTKPSVAQLKLLLSESILEVLEQGQKQAGSKPAEDVCIQQFFDSCYLQEALESRQGKGGGSGALGKHAKSLSDLSGLEAIQVEKVRMGAVDYWNRTSVLLALLS